MTDESTGREPELHFFYKNWRGVVGLRRVGGDVPIRIFFGSSRHHTSPQWLMEAFDLDKQDMRRFAVAEVRWTDTIIGDAARIVTDASYRDHLLASAIPDLATQHASPLANSNVDALNAAVLPCATALLAQVLIGRAMLGVASAWWSDLTGIPEEDARRVLADIMLNPPPGLEGGTYEDPSVPKGPMKAN